MADQTTQKAIEQQPKTTPADANVKAPADTGDRELSDADLDRVAGGAYSTPPPTRNPPARAQ